MASDRPADQPADTPNPGMGWVARDRAERVPLAEAEHDAETGDRQPDTGVFSIPASGGLEDAGRIVPPYLTRLRPVEEDPSAEEGPDTSAYSRPSARGMDEALRIIPPHLARLRPADEDASGEEGPDTSAYSRPSAKDEDEDRPVVKPGRRKGSGSNLEPLVAVPVLEVTPAMRAAWQAQQEAPPPQPDQPPRLTRYTVSSSPGPDQACPECGGELRVVRSTREERLDAAWFRFEWLDVERGWGDCPHHPRVETVPLDRPAFLGRGRVGNGLLAWLATWRWQDHMPAHDLVRLLRILGLRPNDQRLARWLADALPTIHAVADAVRAEVEGDDDQRGLLLIDGRRTGRLRAREDDHGVALSWQEEDEPTDGDQPGERARLVLLAQRGWSREGRQAALRRRLAQLIPVQPQLGARLAWRAEELRRAADADQEAAAMADLQRDLADTDCQRPAIGALRQTLATDRDVLLRFESGTTRRPDLELPETARHRLPRWYASTGDGGATAVADWLTVVESCAARGLPTWRYLRDLFTAAAQQGDALDASKWTPAARS